MPKTTREERIAREKRAWELRQQGWTQERIAGVLGVDQSTVSRALLKLSQRIQKRLDDVALEERVAQVRQLSLIVDEALQAWQASKDPAKSVAKRVRQQGEEQEQGQGGEGSDTEEVTTTRVQDQDGDPRYLTTAMRAMADLRKLLDLDAPLHLTINEVDAAIEQELARLASQGQGAIAGEAPADTDSTEPASAEL
jgi:transcriptional regulator with XRE-family HTH domain